MTTDPFGSIADDSLVEDTAISTGQTELVMTPEQFDALDNKVVRRLAAELDSDEIHGKRPRFVIRAGIAVQHSLSEYADE